MRRPSLLSESIVIANSFLFFVQAIYLAKCPSVNPIQNLLPSLASEFRSFGKLSNLAATRLAIFIQNYSRNSPDRPRQINRLLCPEK
jgi:hypothetical protein